MGAIQERKLDSGNKTYRVQIRIKGEKPISKSFKRKTDAKTWMIKTEAAIREGRYFDISESKKHTVSDLIKRYTNDYLSQKKSKLTPIHNLKWWEERIGHLTLDKVKTPIIKEYWDTLKEVKSKRTKKKFSNRTLNSYLESISSMLSIAAREYGWMQTNPVSLIRKKKVSNQRTRFLDDLELKRFLEEVDKEKNNYLKPAIVLSLSTGGRKSEILGLKWADIDFKNKRVTFRDTKNGDTRSVSLSINALKILKEHSKVRIINNDYVFPNRRPSWKANKVPKPYEDLSSAFERVREKAELIDFRWHDMRHCFASYMLASGATLGEVGKLLGHRCPSMTWRYSHLIQGKADELIDRMNDKFIKLG